MDERINAQTQKLFLLGERLGHTWSPVIHNTLFRRAGENAVYFPLSVRESGLPSAVSLLRMDFLGANVTIPYKEKVIPLLDELDEGALACGAVNTIVCRGGILKGYNTDGMGLARALTDAGIVLDGKRVLILGAGGAARGAAYQVLSHGGEVVLHARNPQRAAAMKTAFRPFFERLEERFICGDEPERAYDLLINCTPVGMFPNIGEAPADDGMIRRCAAVFDAVYNPRETELLQRAQAMGIRTAEGLGMLFYQAVEAERLWFGRYIAAPEIEKEVYRELCASL